MFDQALQRFIDGVNKIKADELGDSKYASPGIVSIRRHGVKYIALDSLQFDHTDRDMKGDSRNMGIYCFIASEDGNTKGLGVVKCGDVLKAASYTKPAKHARGNIFDSDNGLKGAGRFGPAYL